MDYMPEVGQAVTAIPTNKGHKIMEILKIDPKTVQIEFSLAELNLLVGIVYSVEEQFKPLDPIPHQLNEELIADLSGALLELQKAGNQRFANPGDL